LRILHCGSVRPSAVCLSLSGLFYNKETVSRRQVQNARVG